MFNLISGKKGSGKTKELIKMANEDVVTSDGSVVFIDRDRSHMYDLKHTMRLINMSEFPVKTKDEFFGFLCGLISNDYDIESIYIDGLMKVMDIDENDVDEFVVRAKELANKYKIKIVSTISEE